MMSIIIKKEAIIAGFFLPINIGNVLAPADLSPFKSSISFTISRAVVITKAKNPKLIEVIMISGLFIENPPNTNPKHVINPTVK